MTKNLKPLKVIKNEESGTPSSPAEFTPKPIYVIDWEKVTSVDDIKIILKELNLSINIERATEDIKPLLKQVT